MDEIKTCEEYVLLEMFEAQNRVKEFDPVDKAIKDGIKTVVGENKAVWLSSSGYRVCSDEDGKVPYILTYADITLAIIDYVKKLAVKKQEDASVSRKNI